MNKGYLCINDQVVVVDDEGLKPAIEYTDNIEDRLISENVIENLNKELIACNQRYEKNKNRIYTKKEFKKEIIKWSVITGLMIVICPLMACAIYGNPISPKTIFGVPMHFSTLMTISFIPFAALMGAGVTFDNYSSSKNAINENNGLSIEIKTIEQLLNNEKEKLQELSRNKTKENIELANSNQLKNVNDIEELKRMKKLLVTAYNYGYSKEKYQQYYQSGILKEKLESKYDDNTISVYEQFIEQDLNNLDENSNLVNVKKMGK